MGLYGLSVHSAAAILTAAADQPTTGVAGWAVDMMERLGVVGAGLAIALENLFPPLPSEIILPLAGFTASRGQFNLIAAIVATTIGSVVGAAVLYYVGVLIGRDRLRAVVDWMPLVKLGDVDRAEAWFGRHGGKAVFFGRMIPIFRSVISIPAGLERMNIATFLVLTTAGSLIWNTVFIIAGYRLGQRWDEVQKYVGVFQNLVIAAVVIAVVAFVAVRIYRRRRTAA